MSRHQTPNLKLTTTMLRFFGLIILLGTGLAAAAQPPPGEGDWMDRSERVQAQRVAYLTQRLQLTPAEAQQFWPVFTEFENARRELNQQLRPPVSEEGMTEAEAEAFLDRQLQMEEKMLALKRTYVARFRKILPARKIVLLPRADREFKRELLERIRGRNDRRRQ